MGLEHLWAGWRHEYVVAATAEGRAGGEADTADGERCVFCALAQSGPPSVDNGVVWRGDLTFVVVNAFPYASGHVMVLPLRHVSDFAELDAAEAAALWATTEGALAAVTAAYEPDGLNMGANLGRAAGAGIPKHLHLHVVPRWSGDTNFMTAVAGVRVMPEPLGETWRRLHEVWPAG